MPKKCPKALNVHEINARLLAKSQPKRLEHECIGHDGKYRDESYTIYQKKKRQFLETAKQYHDRNKLAMLGNKAKSESDYDDLKFDFLEDVEEKIDNESHERGSLLKKRNERKIHEQMSASVETCTMEPWFKRYLILGRFVQAARKIILKNRLLKNLEKLKAVDELTMLSLETTKKICDNVSYQQLFDAFL